MKILIIEDDPEILEFLRDGFKAESATVDTADNGADGSYMARTNEYDIIILDYSLPKKNGDIVCNEIRASGKMTPIIFLSVLSEHKYKINTLEKGADDYVTKPFSFAELRARVHAILRRPRKIESETICIGDLILNNEKQTVLRGETGIYLTRKEFNLLQFLMKNPGMVLSRSLIMEHVWDAESDPFSNTIESHILNLRKKINVGRRKDLIKNVPGRGYVIEEA